MAKKIAVFVFALVLALGLAEIAARTWGPPYSVFWDNPTMSPYQGGGFDTNTTFEGLHVNKDPHRVDRYARDSSRWYRRETEPTIPPTGKLVFNMGDSSTYGWGLRDHIGFDPSQAYASVLNGLLPEDVRSINFGVPYYSSLQGMFYLEELLSQHADRVVGVTLYFGNNDGSENGASDVETVQRFHDATPLQIWLEGNVGLYRWLHQTRVNLSAAKYSDRVRVTPDEYEENMREMIELCRRYGIPVMVIQPPVRLWWRPAHFTLSRSYEPYLKNPWTIAELNRAKALYQEGVARLYRIDGSHELALRRAIDHDYTVLRIRSAWSEKLAKLEREMGVKVIRLPEVSIDLEDRAFEDYCHPSARVHEQIAKQIAQALGS